MIVYYWNITVLYWKPCRSYWWCTNSTASQITWVKVTSSRWPSAPWWGASSLFVKPRRWVASSLMWLRVKSKRSSQNIPVHVHTLKLDHLRKLICSNNYFFLHRLTQSRTSLDRMLGCMRGTSRPFERAAGCFPGASPEYPPGYSDLRALLLSIFALMRL